MSVPSQMYLQSRTSRVGRKVSAYLARTAGVETVAGDDQVVRAGQLVDVGSLGAVVQRDPELAAAVLQDLQQSTPRHRREAVAAAGDDLALEVHVDVVPDRELRCIRAKTPGSACSMPPSVSSLNTTPKPKVSSAALRSQTVISWPCPGPVLRWPSCWASALK